MYNILRETKKCKNCGAWHYTDNVQEKWRMEKVLHFLKQWKEKEKDKKVLSKIKELENLIA